MKLRNHRRRATWSKLTPAEATLLARFEPDFEQAEEFGGFELADAFDGDTPIYLIAVWPFGAGVVIDLATNEAIADIVQHYFDAHGDQALRERVATAWPSAGFSETVTFRPGTDSPKSVADAGTLDEIRAMRAGSTVDDRAIWALAGRVWDLRTMYRPLPIRRRFELSELEHAMLELLEQTERGGSLAWIGLPSPQGQWGRRDDPTAEPDALAHYLGHAPPKPLDETLELDGQAHPIWCLFHDAIHGVRSVDAVLVLIDALPRERRFAITRAIVTDPYDRLATIIAKDLKEARAEMISNATRQRQIDARVQLIAGLFDRLGDDGIVLARELLADRATWFVEWGSKLGPNDQFQVPSWERYCTALGVLARAGELDDSYDEVMRALACAYYASDALTPILKALRADRAAAIACGHVTLIGRFPSPAGAKLVVDQLDTYFVGPYRAKEFLQIIAAIGEAARSALVAATSTTKQPELVAKALAALDKKARPRRR